MKKKLVVFDFDGVIVDSLAQHTKAYSEICRFFGKALPAETLDEWKAWHDPKWENNYKRLGITDTKKADEIYFKFFDYANTETFEGIKEIIAHLDTKYNLAIVSNTERRLVEKELHKHGIHKHFPVINGYNHDSNKIKRLGEALNTFGTKPEDTVMVGDAAVDIQAGKALGTKTIGILYGFTIEERITREKPDAIARSAKEIPSLIEKLFKS